MKLLTATAQFLRSLALGISGVCALLFVPAAANAGTAEPDQIPLFLSQSHPIMMLNLSKDHQLFYKLYDDFSDLTNATGGDPDGVVNAYDTKYNNAYKYYGYFDNTKCYVYSSTDGRYNPSGNMTSNYCNASASNEWSGNFLNWASMTRIDAIRKILYGGFRSTDTTSLTVLERSFLPNDSHSFAKYYTGSDINKLTPFTNNDLALNANDKGITICNTTKPVSRSYLSQNALGANGAPLLRVAQGDYSLWASSERWQCRWRSDMSDAAQGVNGNWPTYSGMDAHSDSPADVVSVLGVPTSTGIKLGEYNARVSVCVSGYITSTNNEHCRAYTVTSGSTTTIYNKPAGLLQEYGESGQMYFGLMTGSYANNKSGGVLRKAVGSMAAEVSSDGTFNASITNGIIKTLNSLSIWGYRFEDGTYFGVTGSDNCSWGLNTFSNGSCSNWGNPQAEILMESLRYLGGATGTSYASSGNDTGWFSGLGFVSSWTDPITNTASGNFCAKLNILQFNSSVTSYDADEVNGGFFSGLSVDDQTNAVGAREGLNGISALVGEVGNASVDNQLCTPKTIANLAGVEGPCPEAPRLDGGYDMAGLAYWAYNNANGIRKVRHSVSDATLSDSKFVRTYGVSLAPSLPSISVTPPGSSKSVVIIPACRNSTVGGNCAIVDFKIVQPETTSADGTTKTGKVYVNWEDSEQGGDYDQDMWGTLEYKVTSSSVTVISDVIAQSTPDAMGFGYVISGTTNDGFHVHSGINGFNYSGDAVYLGCTSCSDSDAATTQAYSLGSSSATLLKPALYYAAKYGGYTRADDTIPSPQLPTAASTAENYYQANNPTALESSLRTVFSSVLDAVAASATVAANSTRQDSDTMAYQAKFDATNWTGQIQAFRFQADGSLPTTPTWDTNTTLKSARGNIYTYDGPAGSLSLINLSSTAWGSISTSSYLYSALSSGVSSTLAQARYDWLKTSLGGSYNPTLVRAPILMGDIVNADPAYAGGASQRYNLLPAVFGSAYYNAYVDTKVARTKALFVGANDGKMHAFNADTGAELFSYIPRGVYAKLGALSSTSYGHKYTVDGPLYVGDAYLGGDSSGLGGTWKTIVVGTLGAGGRGLFALDVTSVLSGGGAPSVIFDFSADDPDTSNTPSDIKSSLGYIMSKALLVPTANSRWSVIFGNGVNSGSLAGNNGVPSLIAIDVGSPKNAASGYRRAISTATAINASYANGLMGAALLPNSQGIVQYAYAGSILGNLWKFNLTNSSMSNWDSAYKSGSTPAPLVTVTGPTGGIQPITVTPTLGYNSYTTLGSGSGASDGVMVYFGTGKYYQYEDNVNTDTNSIYAILDEGTKLGVMSSTRSGYYKKYLNTSTTTSTFRDIVVGSPAKAETAIDWATVWESGGSNLNSSGWYFDFPAVSGSTGSERVLSKPLLLYDRLIVNTFIPSSYECSYGGSSWLMELVGVGDRFLEHSVLGDNANHILEQAVLGDLIPLITGEKLTILGSGVGDKNNPPKLLTIDGTAAGGSRGRLSWRQIK